MDLVDFSKQTKREAQEILEQTKVLNLLSKYGDVRVGGSFYTDLMYGPDIDVTVATESPREKAVDFLDSVIRQKGFQKYQYGDFENFPRDKRPRDHIVVLILPYKGRKWEIEIWFTKEHYRHQIVLEEKLKSLTQEKKNKIIIMKDERENSGADKHTLSSVDIYKEFI